MGKDENGLRQTRERIAESTLPVNYFIGTVRMRCGKIAADTHDNGRTLSKLCNYLTNVPFPVSLSRFVSARRDWHELCRKTSGLSPRSAPWLR
jgi:hypothetical protein